MLAMFFHDRQIEQDLVERIQAIHIDDSYHTPSAHTFPDVEDQAGLLCAQSRLRFAGPDRKEVLLRHGCRILDVEISVIQHLALLSVCRIALAAGAALCRPRLGLTPPFRDGDTSLRRIRLWVQQSNRS